MSEQEIDCPHENLQVIKKGFSGERAVLCFLGILIISGVAIGIIINEQSKNIAKSPDLSNLSSTAFDYFRENVLLIGLAIIASLLGLFAGTIGMNKLSSVCTKCGQIKSLNQRL